MLACVRHIGSSIDVQESAVAFVRAFFRHCTLAQRLKRA
jgi:hypothetical protein